MILRYENTRIDHFCLLLELPQTAAFCRARLKSAALLQKSRPLRRLFLCCKNQN